jgi:hypothetical protein
MMQTQQDTTVSVLQEEMKGRELAMKGRELATHRQIEEMSGLLAERVREAGERQEQMERAGMLKQEQALEALEQCNVQQRKLLLDGVKTSFSETHSELELVIGSVTAQYQRLLDERCGMLKPNTEGGVLSYEDEGTQILMGMDNSHSRRLLLDIMLNVGQLLQKAKMESASMIKWLEAHALGIASTDPHLTGDMSNASNNTGAPMPRGFPGSPVYATRDSSSIMGGSPPDGSGVRNKDQLKAQARSQLFTFYSNRINNEIKQMKGRKQKAEQERPHWTDGGSSDADGESLAGSGAGAGAGDISSPSSMGDIDSPTDSSPGGSNGGNGGKVRGHRRHLTPFEQDQRHDEQKDLKGLPVSN